MKISVVSTLYKSEKTLPRFYNLISKEIKGITSENYEIILVDDGSPDLSLGIARKIASKDNQISGARKMLFGGSCLVAACRGK